ncbi:MAG: UDP-N-acetylmuramoyl-tripeptide--D-alanyl-D-alanine ligase [Candidatus Omnitrophica bacterium]|nr:UDP-N-acetylmuramoyl-tripeptide--D-alanyl-D-alanine ligase [Candidatus Omnitrophota bacterium]
MKVREIIKITGGKLLSGDLEREVELSKISTDSRSIHKGDFFIALGGANFNGNCFVDEVLEKGAIGALSCTPRVIPAKAGIYARGNPRFRGDQRASIQALDSRLRGNDNEEKILIQVSDTTKALQDIAAYHRKKFRIPVIGVTGSNGKTTVKDMIAGILSQKYNVLKNEGTKNNHIGVPLTLLKLNDSHDMCVVEMGANHRGEIRSLADIARPTVAVITNIGPSHLKFLRDLKGVFAAKREILGILNRDSLAVINGDDEYLSAIKSKVFRIMRFGFNVTNDFHASRVSAERPGMKFTLNDRAPFTLNLIGAHNVSNALAAIAVAYNFDISYTDTKKALSEYSPAGMRLNVRQAGDVTVIDDAYNSNPLSMGSAIEALAGYPAKGRWIVSADMLELGQREEEFHKMIGEAIARSGFSGLITFGRLSRHTSSRALECGMDKNRVWHCSDRAKIADILKDSMDSGDAVLVKGSRAMKMEEVIEEIALALSLDCARDGSSLDRLGTNGEHCRIHSRDGERSRTTGLAMTKGR